MGVVDIIELVVCILTLFGVGAYFTERFKHMAQKKNNVEDQVEVEKRNKIKSDIKDAVKSDFDSINDKLNNIETLQKEFKESAVLSERCNMKVIYDRCKKQGFADIGDKGTMKELYENYKLNGGNHFKEYVDMWCRYVADLPYEKSNEEKKVLNEEQK